MTSRQNTLTAERLKAVLSYDPQTGVYRWRTRCGTGRAIASWNARFAGKEAGTICDNGRGRKYLQITVDGRRHTAQRLAWLYMKGEWPPPGTDVDHEDGDSLNNRFANLRVATRWENLSNRGKTRANTSGFKGVRPHRNKWVARIGHKGRYRHLGTFDTPEQAAEAYAAAAREIHGEFASQQTGETT